MNDGYARRPTSAASGSARGRLRTKVILAATHGRSESKSPAAAGGTFAPCRLDIARKAPLHRARRCRRSL